MIYFLTGIIIIIAVLNYKKRLQKVFRVLGVAYLILAVLEVLTRGFISSILFSGSGQYQAIIYMVLGVAFIVYGTREIRMPMDDIVEDDLLEEHNPLAH